MSNYWRFSRSAYYSVVAALPLLVVYEILVILTRSRYWGIRNAADMWIRTFLMAFDLQAQHLTFVMIGIAFALIPLAKTRSSGVKLKANYFFADVRGSICIQPCSGRGTAVHFKTQRTYRGRSGKRSATEFCAFPRSGFI